MCGSFPYVHGARSLTVLVLVALGLMGSASVASAQTDRGVVLRFRGRAAGQARTAVVQAASERLDLASRRDIEAAAASLGADLSQPAGMAQVAQDQGLTVIITGEVSGRGRNAKTLIHVFDDSGNEVAFRETERPRGRRNRRVIRDAAAEALDQGLAAIAQRRQEEELARQREEEAARQAALAEQQAAVEEEEPAEAPAGALPLVTAFVGIDGRTRDAQAEFVGGGGRSYALSMYPELSLRLESFPLGRSSGAARGIYAQLDLAFALSLSSQEVDELGQPVGNELGSSAWRMLLQAGYQYPISEDAFRLGALIGFGIDSFSIDDNAILASTKYSLLRLGGVADARLYEELVRLRIDFGYRVVFGVGDIASGMGASLGTDASGGGFDVGASLGGHLDMGFAYALRFGFTRYSFDFTGGAENTGFSDKALNLSVQVGYAY